MMQKILAIETSCDETAAAVLSCNLSPNPSPHQQRGTNKKLPEIKILSAVVKSQIKIHSKMGGVVPEAAARAHIRYIRPVVESALKIAKLKIENLDYIAPTQGPGLIVSLAVGVEFAKALSLATKKPLIPINHMLGHLYSPFSTSLSRKTGEGLREGVFPSIALIVSGGHTMLVLMKDLHNYKVIGETVDDAAGECFDKVAKMFKLPYPGGPEVSKLAEKGDPKAINFPRPMLTHKNYNFSFSGLKTAVLYHLQSLPTKRYPLNATSDICASFQEAVVDVLTQKTLRAAKEFGAKSISLSGGVAANRALRQRLEIMSKNNGLKFFPAPLHLTGDNAEMIGIAAAVKLAGGFKPISYKKLSADSNLQI